MKRNLMGLSYFVFSSSSIFSFVLLSVISLECHPGDLRGSRYSCALTIRVELVLKYCVNSTPHVFLFQILSTISTLFLDCFFSIATTLLCLYCHPQDCPTIMMNLELESFTSDDIIIYVIKLTICRATALSYLDFGAD